MVPDILNQTLYVSKDGGKSFSLWKPMHDGKTIFVDQFITIKDVLFGESSFDRLFFYADNELNIFSIQKYEINGLLVPSDFYPSYIIKLVPKFYRVQISVDPILFWIWLVQFIAAGFCGGFS
ncbi:hypothetical protein RF11_06713 [Thelohanellus kitauei]|uniref:Sortilin N-terminal domain-containing protein n=1 Tax=Thelohanellus kitauei TaxID=669202 RepID=A0A0C2JGD0_THEKT|nr:hypothetical protein RF11_06713 [Thelohanellus kitauei]